MRLSRLFAVPVLALVPTLGFAQATVPESALNGPAFSLQLGQGSQTPAPQAPAIHAPGPNQNVMGSGGVQAPPAFAPLHVAPGTPGALIPKRPMGTAQAEDPILHAYVQSLQEQLPAHGYRPGPVTGRLDPTTERAIVAYQRDAGITPDAHSTYVLKATLDSVTFARPPIQAGGARAGAGGTIVFVQQRLAAKGYPTGPADGRLGAKTVTAIKDFQGDRGLPRDGKVTPQLLDLLNRT